MSTTTATRRRQRAAPKLKESCDCCAAAKVRCSRERPQCSRCLQKGLPCQFSFSRRAGRRTTTGNSDPSSPPQQSPSSTSSYDGSPMRSPRRPPFAPMMERSESNTSSDTSSSLDNSYAALPIAPPITPQMTFPDQTQAPALDMWANPPYVSTADDLNAEWFRLTDSFTATARHRHDFGESCSPASSSLSSNSDSLLGNVEPSTSHHPSYHHHTNSDTIDALTMNHMTSPLQASNLLFMEAEAIREELHLVANFIGTLEERVDRGVKAAGLPAAAAAAVAAPMVRHSIDSGFADLVTSSSDQEGCPANAMASQLAFHFSAADLRRRLQNIRNEIECIVGFG